MKAELQKDVIRTDEDLHSHGGIDHHAGVPLRQHFDIVIANLANNLAKAELALQQGLDKAERQLQTSLADSKRDQQIALSEAEKRVNEKFVAFKDSSDKTERGAEGRIANIDSIVQRVERERALYVTRDQLDLILKSIGGEIRPVQTEQSRLGARADAIVEYQQSLRWMVAFIVSTVLGTLGIVVALVYGR